MWCLLFLSFLSISLSASENPLDFEKGICIECHNIDAETLARKYSKKQWQLLAEDIKPFEKTHKDELVAVTYINSLEFKQAFPKFIKYMKEHGNNKKKIIYKDSNILFELESIDNIQYSGESLFKKIQQRYKKLALLGDVKVTLTQGNPEVSARDTIFKFLFIITPIQVVMHWNTELFFKEHSYSVHTTVDSDKNESIETKFNEILEDLLKTSKILI